MGRSKLSVTVPDDLAHQIQKLATSQSQPVSHLVERALKQFVEAQLAAEMEEGYRAMGDFDLALAEADMAVGYEVLPDA